MTKKDLRDQIDKVIREEIQQNINEYVDSRGSSGLGFIEEDELKVNISQREIDKIMREYKKIKKSQKSNLFEIKKLSS
jgi:hypothetical protein